MQIARFVHASPAVTVQIAPDVSFGLQRALFFTSLGYFLVLLRFSGPFFITILGYLFGELSHQMYSYGPKGPLKFFGDTHSSYIITLNQNQYFGGTPLFQIHVSMTCFNWSSFPK